MFCSYFDDLTETKEKTGIQSVSKRKESCSNSRTFERKCIFHVVPFDGDAKHRVLELKSK